MKKGIAVIGAGLVGRRHARAIKNVSSASLVALVDPNPDTANLANEMDTAWFTSLSALLNSGTADGIVRRHATTFTGPILDTIDPVFSVVIAYLTR